MPTASKAASRPKGPVTSSTQKPKASVHSSLRHKLLIYDAAELYQTERSRVYTVICIAFVGLSLVGLGVGLIIYAIGLSISDLIVVGAIGVFIGVVSLFVAMSFLVKPILAKRHRNRVAALSARQREADGYLDGKQVDISLADVQLQPEPSNTQLYGATELVTGQSVDDTGTLKIAHPTDDAKTPTYNVDVAYKDDEIKDTGL